MFKYCCSMVLPTPLGAAAAVQALLLLGLSTSCTSFSLHPLPHPGLLRGCMWRSVFHGAHGLQGDRPSLPRTSPWLQLTSAALLGHLLPSLGTNLDGYSCFSLPATGNRTRIFHCLNLLSQMHSPCCSWLSSTQQWGSCWSI